MASIGDSITRSHEHYLRHLLLLGEAAPLALNALIRKEESKHGKTVNYMVRQLDNKKIPPHLTYTKPDSWSTRDLCDVISILFGQRLSETEPEIMKCVEVITEQRKDMEKYAKSASLPFEVFEKKWNPLHCSLLELIKNTDAQAMFECTRMITSFQLEPIHVNSDLIKKLRETIDVDSQVKIVIQEKVFTEIHGNTERLENKRGQENDDRQLENEVVCNPDDKSTAYEIRGKRAGMEKKERQDASDDRKDARQCDAVDNPHDEFIPHAVSEFTEQLQDTFAYVDEPAILTCKLNTAKATVRWRKDYAPLEEKETLKFVNSQYCHWLAISNAQLTDTGLYSCECENAISSASLKVTGKPLKIDRELHVDMEEPECRENMDISLVCTVNVHAGQPVWKHNSNEIADNLRIFASSLELEHKLIIRNVQFEDEGEYTVDFGEVTSSTSLTIEGNLDFLHEKQLSEELYKNWIRGSLGLKYLKIGLQNITNQFVKDQHSEFLSKLSNSAVCNNCTSEKLLPLHHESDCKNKNKCGCKEHRKRMKCPSSFCSRFYDMIIDSHRFFEPLLANTDVQTWNSEPWSVATCYISTTGYKGKKSATEVDCAGLLSLFINDRIFQKYIGDVDINGKTDVFKKARDARNEILHNPAYELSKGQLDDFISLFKNVLEIRDVSGESPLLKYQGVESAVYSLNELQNHQIDVCLKKQMSSLREDAQHEEAETLKKAEEKKDRKIQQLEEKLRQAEQELQLMNAIRTSKAKKFSKAQKEPLELELRIQVLKSTTETFEQANQLIFQLMIVDVARHYNVSDVATTSTALSKIVQRILSYIYKVKDTKIAKVVSSGSSVDLKIQCFSCKAIDQMLASINGIEFQKVKFELRKYFEMEGGAEKSYEVVVKCFSQSLDDTRRQLCERRLIKEVTTDFTCHEHSGMRIVSYCSNHDQLCCSTCREEDHRACFHSNKTYKRDDQMDLPVKTTNKRPARNIANIFRNSRDSYDVHVSKQPTKNDKTS